MQNPEGNNHESIRAFMRQGWRGIQFEQSALLQRWVRRQVRRYTQSIQLNLFLALKVFYGKRIRFRAQVEIGVVQVIPFKVVVDACPVSGG